MAFCTRRCTDGPLRQSERRFNRLISKHRFRVEHCFGTMKRLFGLQRARYFGVAKTPCRGSWLAISQNWLKATNRIILNPKPRQSYNQTLKTNPSREKGRRL